MFLLLKKTVIVITIALILSIGIDILYRQTYHKKYQWPKNIWIMPDIPHKYQIVKLGNSHADDGLTFANYNLRSIALSSAAQSFEYDLAMLKMYQNQIDKRAIIVINVSPMSFSQKKPDKAESLQYKYYDGRLSPFLIPHIQAGDYIQSQIIPFVRAVTLWRDDHAKEVKNKAMNTYAANWTIPQEEISPKVEITPKITKIPSRDSIAITPKKSAEEELDEAPFSPDDRLQVSVNFMVQKWLYSGGFGREDLEANSRDLEKLIKYSLEKGWRPVLISIPISQRLINGLGGNYMENFLYKPLKKTNLHGSDFFDFSVYKKLRESAHFYTNSDHLSEAGAHIVSHMLIERLILKGYITEKENGFN